MGALDNEKVIVTAGARGIGQSICQRLVEEGASVTLFDIDVDAGRKTAEATNATFIQVDVTDPAAVHAAVTQAVDRMGDCSILINNAGGGYFPLVQPHKYTMDEFHNCLKLNFNSCF